MKVPKERGERIKVAGDLLANFMKDEVFLLLSFSADDKSLLYVTNAERKSMVAYLREVADLMEASKDEPITIEGE